ncbi:tRNA (adenine(22)-N(1))-methyltransferase [Mesobacillus zeae]|uniref:tRNA (Adenine-N(1))-methyltransferase n=1 Tax=Mesobacillus zeae TaxID=1917180 RepID=A0A398B7E3_9BACI|nr:tRNA (adenine(22)-N(1))-methyltransferase TrmK [Mesobacillus zeae]RID83820.1 tRNA (adenine-N(1))-methyltransferase [Mesobacillus zeae]
MNTEKLSERLTAVAEYIPSGSRIADIGSDHAYLPCYAVKTGAVSFAVAGEVAKGPYLSAASQVKKEGLTKKIDVRKGDGLEVVTPGEVDCITIAGMGGALIASILENGKDKLGEVKRLILQPNVGAFAVREWLIRNKWELISERILKEDGKIYEILAAERGEPLRPYTEENFTAEKFFGPFLLKECNESFREKWNAELLNWERILEQLKEAGHSEGTENKKQEIQAKILMTEEALSQ